MTSAPQAQLDYLRAVRSRILDEISVTEKEEDGIDRYTQGWKDGCNTIFQRVRILLDERIRELENRQRSR